MKHTPFYLLTRSSITILAILLVACSAAPVSIDTSAEQPTRSAIKSDTESGVVDSTSRPVDCLDLEFIENLESDWDRNKAKLKQKGFTVVSEKTIENGKKIHFENSPSKFKMEISSFNYPQGEQSYKVEYIISADELSCLEEQLTKSKYRIDAADKYLGHDRYLKKGLGSYEKKMIIVNKSLSSITYLHNVGKELAPAPPLHKLP